MRSENETVSSGRMPNIEDMLSDIENTLNGCDSTITCIKDALVGSESVTCDTEKDSLTVMDRMQLLIRRTNYLYNSIKQVGSLVTDRISD